HRLLAGLALALVPGGVRDIDVAVSDAQLGIRDGSQSEGAERGSSLNAAAFPRASVAIPEARPQQGRKPKKRWATRTLRGQEFQPARRRSEPGSAGSRLEGI